MQEHPRTPMIPRPIHVVNVSAVLLVGMLLLLTAITRTYQLIILLPVLGLLVVYRYLHTHPSVVAWYFAMALALLGWILLCENLVPLDKMLGTYISSHLRLGVRLETYTRQTLYPEKRGNIEDCCNDALTWHYHPGSHYRGTFDCPTCQAPYEVRINETGYLNRSFGLMQDHHHIDLFLAGDSVLQGMGVPSVVEWMLQQIPLRMWNLSMQGYGPRQKINALLTYALPKAPHWLVVEFYAGNDLPDAIRDDVCQDGGDFHCRYNAPEVHRRLARHPLYTTIFNVRTDVWARVAEYSPENLTLATTRYLFDALKQRVMAMVHSIPYNEATAQSSPSQFPLEARSPAPVHTQPPAITQIAIHPWLALAGGPPAPVRAGQWQAYIHAGLAATQHQYERLGAVLAEKAHPPAVILLYNPAPYEVYRGMGMDPNPRAEQLYTMQREALRTFAHTQGWHFLDLTEPLRGVVRGGEIWLYGHYDQSHWSSQGTAMVAEVLATELSKIVHVNAAVRQRPPAP